METIAETFNNDPAARELSASRDPVPTEASGDTEDHESGGSLTIGGFLNLLAAADPRAQGFRPAFAFDPGQTLLRKTAARILHFYLRDILAEPDIPDITPAAVLKDLYDCRVCVNSIAQMYLRRIMEARTYPGDLLLFDGNVPITCRDAEDAVRKLLSSTKDF